MSKKSEIFFLALRSVAMASKDQLPSRGPKYVMAIDRRSSHQRNIKYNYHPKHRERNINSAYWQGHL